ncbi:hypothetical protein GCM10020331_025230 [Ectobacillus funiculus]
MLVTVNPNENTTKLVSIPRDTYVTIEGKGRQDKVNHAYAFGGVPMTLNTLERFLGIPIDYYIEVNMQGFQEIVDAVGGVTVHNTFPFSYEGHSFAAGSIPLNGAQALAYARMRKEDPKGDFWQAGAAATGHGGSDEKKGASFFPPLHATRRFSRLFGSM